MIQHDPCLCSICIGGFLSYTYMLLMIANLIHDHRFESEKKYSAERYILYCNSCHIGVKFGEVILHCVNAELLSRRMNIRKGEFVWKRKN